MPRGNWTGVTRASARLVSQEICINSRRYIGSRNIPYLILPDCIIHPREGAVASARYRSSSVLTGGLIRSIASFLQRSYRSRGSLLTTACSLRQRERWYVVHFASVAISYVVPLLFRNWRDRIIYSAFLINSRGTIDYPSHRRGFVPLVLSAKRRLENAVRVNA